MKVNNLILNFASYISKIVPLSLKKYIYKSSAISTTIRSGLNRLAPEGYSQVSVAAGTNEGLEMLLDLQVEKDYWLGTYEPELQQVIEIMVKPEQIVYDIGANIGFITLMFARLTGESGHVYAIEALPENVKRLKQNIGLNGYQERVTVIQAAVKDQAGETDFLIGPSGAMGKVKGSAGRDTVDYQEGLRVQGISIDGLIDKAGYPSPDIVKIDIEGGEVLALPGMAKLLHQKHPLVFLELHGPESAKSSWEHLIDYGYRICGMAAEFPQIEKLEDLDWKSYIVAFPDE